MAIQGILRYTFSAALFGAAVGFIWLIRRIRRGGRLTRRDWLRLAMAVYLGMILQIIGLRLGLQRIRPFTMPPHWNLMETTLEQLRLGPWKFIYHTLGNLLWFVPMGILLPLLRPRCRWYHALLAGAAVSLAVEVLQFILGTGEPDVDDLTLNALGALIGYALYLKARRLKIFNRPRA